jgi:uncharacterized coiled-coil DUF342 family protein
MQRFKQDYERDEKIHLRKISELEAEIKQIHKLNNEYLQEISRLQSEAVYVQKLKNEYLSLLKKHNSLKTNNRGAGRKTKLNDEIINSIRQYRNKGKSQNEIAMILNLSVGLINKACKLYLT